LETWSPQFSTLSLDDQIAEIRDHVMRLRAEIASLRAEISESLEPRRDPPQEGSRGDMTGG
jgi:hypothetical protein